MRDPPGIAVLRRFDDKFGTREFRDAGGEAFYTCEAPGPAGLAASGHPRVARNGRSAS
jgi:hypothetical protein